MVNKCSTDHFRNFSSNGPSLKFAVKIVRLKVYTDNLRQSDDLDLRSRSQLRLKLDSFF